MSDQANDTGNDLGAFADGMEGDGFSASSFDKETPHPALGEAPHNFANEDHGDFDDDIPLPDYDLPDREKLPPEIIEACVVEPQNDTGNGKRLLNWFSDSVLHVREIGWHAWNETHWRREGGSEFITRCAQITAARIAIEADFILATPMERHLIEEGESAAVALKALKEKAGAKPGDEQKRQMRLLERAVEQGEMAKAMIAARKSARRKYAVSSGNAGKIRGMIDQALPHRTIDPVDLDNDKLAFNVRNGTVHFVCERVPDPDGTEANGFTREKWRAELREHNRADNISKEAPVIFDPDATCPKFDAAITRFQPIEPVRRFLQRYHGYAMTGLTGEQCLVFNYGTGSNWKSTFIEIVSRIMGDYCMTLAFESLAGDNQKSGGQATPDIARLPGARLVRASEPERNVHFKEALIKSLTGGEPMLARHNFKDFFEFRPDFKLVLSGNHKPEIGGVDHGIWRRIRFVPWPVTISDAEKRPMDNVMTELWAEASGILNWLIAGTLDYLNGGLNTPQEVIDATAEYREEMDPVGSFVGDCVCAVDADKDGEPQSVVTARAMYDAFSAWCEHNAVRAWKEKSFATAMSQKGFVKDRVDSGRRYLHVKLQNVPERKPREPSRENQPPHPADAINDEVPM